MVNKIRWVGTQGKGAKELEAHVHAFKTANGDHVGGVVLQERFLNFVPEFHPFLNDDFGTAMNQAVTFGGDSNNATVIHAGVNSGQQISSNIDGGPTAFKLIDSGGGFTANAGPGGLVHNTAQNTFAIVDSVDSNTQLTLDTDIMDVGSEAYILNDIWVGTAVAGTWNFADGGEISITSANDNDEATFTVASTHVWKMGKFTVLTGKVDLDIYNSSNNTILIEFGLNGTLVGNVVNLNTFINTGDFTAQTFVIPKIAFGLSTQDVNSMRIIITRIGGTKPTIKFDDLQWESKGNSITYTATTSPGTRFHITEIRIRIEDAISAVLTDGSMPNIDPSAILGVPSLTNGIIFGSVKKGQAIFSVTLKNLGDFFATGSNMINLTGDATNTGLTLVVFFPEPLILDGDPNSFLSFTINDTMTNLTRFTAAARGALEV